MLNPWRGLYIAPPWMDDARIRARIIAGAGDWLGDRIGLMLKADWQTLEPDGPRNDYPILTSALAWAASLRWPTYVSVGCVGALTHRPSELPAWAAADVQTVAVPGRRPYLVAWDSRLIERWQGFVARVAAVVVPQFTATPLRWGTIGVAAPGQDAEMDVTSAYLAALRTAFSDDEIGERWRQTWLDGVGFHRTLWGVGRMLTFSPGDILIGDRMVTREILDLVVPLATVALGNGNLGKYPRNAPSRWQQAYRGRCPLVGLTETPPEGEPPGPALDAELERVYRPLGIVRVTLKPDAAGVGRQHPSAQHQAALRSISAYLRREI